MPVLVKSEVAIYSKYKIIDKHKAHLLYLFCREWSNRENLKGSVAQKYSILTPAVHLTHELKRRETVRIWLLKIMDRYYSILWCLIYQFHLSISYSVFKKVNSYDFNCILLLTTIRLRDQANKWNCATQAKQLATEKEFQFFYVRRFQCDLKLPNNKLI